MCQWMNAHEKFLSTQLDSNKFIAFFETKIRVAFEWYALLMKLSIIRIAIHATQLGKHLFTLFD